MTRGRRLVLGVIGVLLGAGLLAGPAEAHRPSFIPAVDVGPEPVAAPDPATTPANLAWTAAPTPAGIPWPLVAALAGLTAGGVRRPRRNLALALVLLLAVFALESGVHSVHHLTDVDRGESCAVASASQHIAGTEVDAVLGVETLPPARPLAATDALIERARFIGPERGRSPPAFSA